MNAAPRGDVILFDGVCALCNGVVRFVIKRDRAAHFSFAALQSDAARTLLNECGVREVPDSIVVIHKGRALLRSDAVLHIARHLHFPWPCMRILAAIPRPLRDWMYDIIARRRYRWFGQLETCMVPTRETSARFLS